MTVKYHASAHFDVDAEVEVEDALDDLAVWIAITDDLERRFGLKIDVQS